MLATARRTALVGSVVAGSLMASAASATAATEEPTTLHVEGTQIQVSENLYDSLGGLLGDFWILTFDPLYESDSFVVGTGSERWPTLHHRLQTEVDPATLERGDALGVGNDAQHE